MPPARTDQARALARDLRECIERRRQQTSEGLLDFIPRISRRFEAPRHLTPIARLFERAVAGEPVRALVSVPPRHGKTETILHGIAWGLRRHPEATFAYASYAADIARSKSRQARDYAREAGVALRDDAGALHEWRTPQGGGVLATGIGGPLTGHGARVLVVDDPHKNREEADSRTIRDNVEGWFTSTAMTRLEPQGSAIIVHTRWHEDDLIGRLVRQSNRYHATHGADGEAWEYVNLQAIDEVTGAALWPDRWPAEVLDRRRRSVGEYDWSALYQGRPRPRGGAVFRDVSWFDAPPSNGYRIAIGVDFAYTAKTYADYSCAVVLAQTDKASFILEVVRQQCEAPAFAGTLARLRERYPGAKIAGYLAGTENGVVDFFAREGVKVEKLPIGGADKFTRAQAVAAAWNRGDVRVRSGASWAQTFVDEVCEFTGVNDPHDDQVDALAGAFDALNKLRTRQREYGDGDYSYS